MLAEEGSPVLRQVRLSGYEPERRRGQSEADLQEVLRSAPWDVIVADCIEDEGALERVVHVVHRSGNDVPVILVSGVVGEEVVAHSLRSGAADHIARDELSRLGASIARMLPACAGADGATGTELRPSASEHDVGALVLASHAGLMVVDLSGVVRFANPAAARMLGIRTEGLVGQDSPVPIPTHSGMAEVDLYDALGAPTVVEARSSRIRWNAEDAVLLTLHEITGRKRAETRLRESLRDLAYTLSKAMASRDPYTTSHQRRVADLVVLVGARMGLSDGQLWELRLGGLMHDVGKVAVPDEILAKPGRLTSEEMELVWTHCEHGYEILRGAGLSPTVPLMALHHHEALDGSGYPQHLTGESLSVQDRILIACNMVESISSFRLYRRALSKEATIAKLVSGRGTKYDAGIVDCLLDILESGEFVLNG